MAIMGGACRLALPGRAAGWIRGRAAGRQPGVSHACGPAPALAPVRHHAHTHTVQPAPPRPAVILYWRGVGGLLDILLEDSLEGYVACCALGFAIIGVRARARARVCGGRHGMRCARVGGWWVRVPEAGGRAGAAMREGIHAFTAPCRPTAALAPPPLTLRLSPVLPQLIRVLKLPVVEGMGL